MVSAWGTGAAINVCGSILINLGTNVMKLGHNRRAACESNIKPPIRAYKPWQIGVCLFILGNILNFFSFGFAAQSLLAALGSVQFVSNVFFASAVLGEKVTKRVLTATLCIVIGCVLLVSFGNHESQTLTVADMLSFYASPVYVSFLVVLVIITGCLFFVYHYAQQKLAWMGREAMDDEFVKLLPVTFALFSGTIGTQSVLFCKTLSTLLRTSLAGESQLQSWFFWLTFLSFVGTAYFWISRLNLALQLFPAIMIVPMMQISWTLFSILSGGIYFQEYKTMSLAQGCGYGLGVGVVFVGVYLLTPSDRSVLVRPGDLEAGLVLGGSPGEGSAPLVDMIPPMSLHSRQPSDLYSQGRSEELASTSLLGGLGTGGLKGLASNTLERRLISSDGNQLPLQLPPMSQPPRYPGPSESYTHEAGGMEPQARGRGWGAGVDGQAAFSRQTRNVDERRPSDRWKALDADKELRARWSGGGGVGVPPSGSRWGHDWGAPQPHPQNDDGLINLFRTRSSGSHGSLLDNQPIAAF